MDRWKRCPNCAERVEERLAACPFCELPMVEPTSPARSGFPKGTLTVLTCAAIAAVVLVLVVPTYTASRRPSNERNASASLKTIGTAQADFRSNDRDNNGVQDFWTGDIAGLYCIDAGRGSPIKLIEVGVARADIAPNPGLTVGRKNRYGTPVIAYGKRSAHAGYWYATLVEGGDVTPRGVRSVYAQNTGGAREAKHHLSRFGACAMHECYGSTGNKVFILNEGNTMFKRDFGADVLNADTIPPTPTGLFDRNWPSDQELGEWWSRAG